MIIPFIFSLDPTSLNRPFLWSFYKGVSFAKKKEWPVIAQKRYFDMNRNDDEYIQLLQEEACSKFGYDRPEEKDFDRIMKIEIPDVIEQRFVSRYPSQTDAYVASLTVEWKEMEDFLENELKKIENIYDEKIEALMLLQGCEFVRRVAEKLNILVIHYEWGPFRAGMYRDTAYFDFNGIAGDLSVQERFQNFINCEYEKQVPILSRREILAIFLSISDLHYATYAYQEPNYEMGMACGYTIPGMITARNGITPMELFTKARDYFKESQIAIRYHPGDPMHCNLHKANEATGSLIDFIMDCKRVACICSNVSYEALLFGKPVYEVKWSQYGFICNNLNDGLEDKVPDDTILSYIAFAILVPYELLNSVEYIRFRIKEKDEKKIYLYHLRYYLSIYGIDESIMKLPTAERIEAIISVRRKKMEIQNEELPIEKTFGEEVRFIVDAERKYELLKKYNQSLLEEIAYRDERIKNLEKELNEYTLLDILRKKMNKGKHI